MNILVLGAGTVGQSIAELLSQAGHSVTIVDRDPKAVQQAEANLDVRGLVGLATSSAVLFQAGAMVADLCLSCTDNDEANLLAASVAKQMGSRKSIARVHASFYRDFHTFDYQRSLNIDQLLSLEQLTAFEMAKTIRNPASLAVENFARGMIEMQELQIGPRAKVLSQPLADLGLPAGVRVGSVRRGDRLTIPGPEDELAAGDWVTLVGTREELDTVKRRFRGNGGTRRTVVIAGGGETGQSLATVLEGRQFAVRLIERDRQRCEELSEKLSETTVLHGDVTSRAFLEEERVGQADVFVAAMGEDEDNIMASVEAKELGVGTCFTVIHRPDYANVVAKLGIDYPVSPRTVMAREVLSHVSAGPISRMTRLAGGQAEVVEFRAAAGAAAIGVALRDLPLPRGCLLAAILREDYAVVPGADAAIQPGDTVVAILTPAVRGPLIDLFTVKATEA